MNTTDRVIAGQVYHFKSLSGYRKLYSELKLFPTPFKGIYYAPYETERDSWAITDPLKVLFSAARICLGTDQYYYGLRTALYFLRQEWHCPEAHIMNGQISRRINRTLPEENYWRGKIIRKILNSFPSQISFHRIAGFSMDGTGKSGTIAFSSGKKTIADAKYLCGKGNKEACRIAGKNPKPQSRPPADRD